ncbi:MAG: hypothetical protein ABUL72_01795, partial [Armatimonadota bacterium]
GMFKSPAYIKQDGHPLLMVFGPQYYKDEAWAKAFSGLKNPPNFYTLMFRHPGAYGAYSWPTPQKGAEYSFEEMRMYKDRAKEWKGSVPVVYPRFEDVYKEAGLGYGYPKIPDDNGKTLAWTIADALSQKPEYIQIATWNDWGEGTQVEPSVELGYTALATISAAAGGAKEADLKLAYDLWKWRSQGLSKIIGDKAHRAIAKGDYPTARKLLGK